MRNITDVLLLLLLLLLLLFTILQTAITRNRAREYTNSLNELIGCEELVDCHEIWPEHSLSIKERKSVGDFLHHEYFSCDRGERNRVGKLFDTVTLRVNKKITNKNIGKARLERLMLADEHCAVVKHYCLRLIPD